MSFEIRVEFSDGTEDTLVVSGESIEEIQAVLERELSRRGATYLGSREIEELR